MARTPLDLDDLVEHWTLLKDEQGLVSGKRGATRLHGPRTPLDDQQAGTPGPGGREPERARGG